jgi:hypothetical protein
MKSSIKVSRGGRSITFRGGAARAAFEALTGQNLPSVANKVERQAGADALPAGELASVPARSPAGERASD